MDDKQFEKLGRKLDLVLKMLAIDKLGGKKQVEQVAMLSAFGFRPSEIALVLERDIHDITSILAKLRKHGAGQ